MLKMARNALQRAHFNDALSYENDSTLSKIRREIRKEAFEDAWAAYLGEVIEYMVSMIDGYEHDVPEQDTFEYFYGCDIELDNLFGEERKTLVFEDNR